MELVDTHCHIQSAGDVLGERQTHDLWRKDLSLTSKKMVKEALADRVSKMIAVGCNTEDSRLAINCAKNFKKQVFASIGIHPHEAKVHNSKDSLAEFANLINPDNQKVIVAVGECGLDYYYGYSPKKDQFKVLEFQIDLALKNNLPMIFHVREAFDDFWPIFDNFKGVKGVLHSFTDSKKNLDKAINKGLYIGVNGIVTFAKSEEQKDVYKAIPLANLLLETDAPFLTPVPLRGKINSPRNVRLVANFLALLKGQKFDMIATATSTNAHDLFGV